MSDDQHLSSIRELIAKCTPEERQALFSELRAAHQIHEFEAVIGAPAEMILEAVHRAPELTRRMLRGVIADAAFRMSVIPALEPHGWRDVTPEGNFAYDYSLDDGGGPVTVQVKLQRSKQGTPVVEDGAPYGFAGQVFITETQKTRSGTDSEKKKTRPYRYGEFDVLAVSMQPATGKWDRYMYTLGRWLLPGRNEGAMATLQPVSKTPGDFWTDDFRTATQWFRAEDDGKRMVRTQRAAVKRPPRKRASKGGNDTGSQLA